MEAEIVTDQDRLDILWFHGNKSIPENDEHFTMTTNLNKTVLDIHNTLPSHDSKYYVKVYKSENHDYYDVNAFKVEVHGKIIFTHYCVIHEFISAYVNVLYITKVLLSFFPVLKLSSSSGRKSSRSPKITFSYSRDWCRNKTS